MKVYTHPTHDQLLVKSAERKIQNCINAYEIKNLILEPIKKNNLWRGQECLNMVAADAPTTPIVRSLLSSEIGCRGTGGHIGRMNRCFAGMKYIDEIESLCIALLKKVFRCQYTDHRLMGGMAACHAVYTSLAQPGDAIMSVPPSHGGDSSNRKNGPPGARGLHVFDIPFFADDIVVDMEKFEKMAKIIRPKIVNIGLTMSLFAIPIQEMKKIIEPWGGKLFFDAAHQAGLIAAGLYQDPLTEGADVMSGSAGKTFSGPQSGLLLWNDNELTEKISETIFPTLTGSHQANRVAALAMASAEFLYYGYPYMQQTVKNAQALGKALEEEGIQVFGSHRNFTQTHQIMIHVKDFGGGHNVAQTLEKSNIIASKMSLPSDGNADIFNPSGLRLGTIEMTRYGMQESDMKVVAHFISRLLKNNECSQKVKNDVIEFRKSFQTIYYGFENKLPPFMKNTAQIHA